VENKTKGDHKLEYMAYLSDPKSGTKTRNSYSFEAYCKDNNIELKPSKKQQS